MPGNRSLFRKGIVSGMLGSIICLAPLGKQLPASQVKAEVPGKNSNTRVSQIYENISVNSNNFISFCLKQAANVPYPGEICPIRVTIKCQQGV